MGSPSCRPWCPYEDGPKANVKVFKDCTPGLVHLDAKYLPQMPDEDARDYLFAAIDKATRWVESSWKYSPPRRLGAPAAPWSAC